jgi:protein O-GlcNAc transferase
VAALAPLAPPLPAASLRRVGFVSSDLTDHIVGRTIAPLLNKLKWKFELFTFALTPPDGSAAAAAIGAASLRIDLSAATTREAARVINDHKLSILIDLNGHTRGGRPEILALQPARRQVND